MEVMRVEPVYKGYLSTTLFLLFVTKVVAKEEEVKSKVGQGWRKLWGL